MRRYFVISLTVLTLLASACTSPADSTPAPAAKLKVVATFSILGDIVQSVAGDQIELRTLVGPEADSHTFEPSPADGAALSEAAVIFEIGLGFEAWLDDLYEASGSQARRVVVTQGLTPGTIAIGDEAGETDPHAWQDVSYVISMTHVVRDALVNEDEANADAYRANAESYLQQLEELDQYIQTQVATLPADRRKLVTNHDALGYFAKRYGFEIIGTVLGTTTEGGGPSAAEIAALVAEVKGAGVPAIFTENVENSKIIEQVAQEAGVVVAPPLYTDALGMPGNEGETYLKLMRYNADTIVAALGK